MWPPLWLLDRCIAAPTTEAAFAALLVGCSRTSALLYRAATAMPRLLHTLVQLKLPPTRAEQNS